MNKNYCFGCHIDSGPPYYCSTLFSDHIPSYSRVIAEIFFSFDFHYYSSSVFLPLNFSLSLPLLKLITHQLHPPRLLNGLLIYLIFLVSILIVYLPLLLPMSQNMEGQVLQPFPVNMDMDVNITWIKDDIQNICFYIQSVFTSVDNIF